MKAKRNIQKPLQWTIYQAATEFGVDRQTIQRGLTAINCWRGLDGTYTTGEISRAVFGDVKLARLRKLNAEASLIELRQKQEARELISMEDARGVLCSALSPVRQRFLALPIEMASRTNPQDPAFARAALEQWTNEALKLCREELLK